MFLLIMLLILLQPLIVSATINNNDIAVENICYHATQAMEKNYNIKKHLLTTIASVESGRWNEKAQQKLAWPWTLNAQGKGYFFNTKAEAVQKVKELRAQGIKSVDVGCMQINMAYHGHEFNSIEEAFDPMHNVEYAAKFLTSLYENNNKDWLKAAMSYHSSSPAKAQRYRKKIVETFETVKTAHNDLDATLFVTQKTNKTTDKDQSASEKVAKTISAQIPEKKVVSQPKLDVNAWREAKLEEYRLQKLLARKY